MFRAKINCIHLYYGNLTPKTYALSAFQPAFLTKVEALRVVSKDVKYRPVFRRFNKAPTLTWNKHLFSSWVKRLQVLAEPNNEQF